VRTVDLTIPRGDCYIPKETLLNFGGFHDGRYVETICKKIAEEAGRGGGGRREEYKKEHELFRRIWKSLEESLILDISKWIAAEFYCDPKRMAHCREKNKYRPSTQITDVLRNYKHMITPIGRMKWHWRDAAALFEGGLSNDAIYGMVFAAVIRRWRRAEKSGEERGRRTGRKRKRKSKHEVIWRYKLQTKAR